MTNRYWCLEGCGFVDENHRCQQWCNIVRIPEEAVEMIEKDIIDKFISELFNQRITVSLADRILHASKAVIGGKK